MQIAFVDQGYTGEEAAQGAKQHGIKLEVVKHSEAKRGFVLLPQRWVVERTFGWLGHFRRLQQVAKKRAVVSSTKPQRKQKHTGTKKRTMH